MTTTILTGDCRDILPTLPAGSVQTCVTSPPYFGLRDYGVEGQIGLEATVEAFVAELVTVFREVRRVLADDGTLWLNLGDSYNAHPGQRKTTDKAGPKQMTNVGAPGAPSRSEAALAPKNLIGVPWRVAFALQADGWILRQDIIWCLSGGTSVYARTQKGEMPMTIKDMVRLDPSTVQLWNGEKWTQVLGWSQSETRDGALELELRSGQRIGCTPGHQWPTQRGVIRTEDLRVGDVIQTCQLPEPELPRRPSRLSSPDIGWFIGMYIAEGSQSDGTIQIACHADDRTRFARLQELAEAFDGRAAMHVTSANGATINIASPALLGILNTYVAGKTAKDKHLHSRCWKRDNEFLSNVLTGYLEGDGHFDGYNQRWRLGFTQNDALATDLRTLCARLGYGLRLKRTFHKMFDQRFPGYRGEIRFDRSAHHNAKQDGEIVAIGQSRARQFWDIGVADEPHLFALASGVLTHNSKPNPMPESVTDRCTKSHEYLFLLSKSPRYYFDASAIAEPTTWDLSKSKMPDGWDTGPGGHGSFHRNGREKGAPSSHKGSAFDRGKTAEHQLGRAQQGPRFGGTKYGDDDAEESRTKSGNVYTGAEKRNKRSVWTISTQPFKEAHFATFPEALVEPCILAGSREGDTVLDPFGGSGTTGLVSARLGRAFIGIELNPDYAAMSKRRIEAAAPLFNRVTVQDLSEVSPNVSESLPRTLDLLGTLPVNDMNGTASQGSQDRDFANSGRG